MVLVFCENDGAWRDEPDVSRSFKDGIGCSRVVLTEDDWAINGLRTASGAGLGEWTNKAQLNTNAPNDTAEIHKCMMVLLIFCIIFLIVGRVFTATRLPVRLI